MARRALTSYLAPIVVPPTFDPSTHESGARLKLQSSIKTQSKLQSHTSTHEHPPTNACVKRRKSTTSIVYNTENTLQMRFIADIKTRYISRNRTAPNETLALPLPGPTASTGVCRWEVVPSPTCSRKTASVRSKQQQNINSWTGLTCFLSLLPQQRIAPFFRTAQECA